MLAPLALQIPIATRCRMSPAGHRTVSPSYPLVTIRAPRRGLDAVNSTRSRVIVRGVHQVLCRGFAARNPPQCTCPLVRLCGGTAEESQCRRSSEASSRSFCPCGGYVVTHCAPLQISSRCLSTVACRSRNIGSVCRTSRLITTICGAIQSRVARPTTVVHFGRGRRAMSRIETRYAACIGNAQPPRRRAGDKVCLKRKKYLWIKTTSSGGTPSLVPNLI